MHWPVDYTQGFMQDNIFASHFVAGHVDVNSHTYKPVEVCCMTWNKLKTHFQGISMVFEDLLLNFLPTHHLSSDISTRPHQVLIIQMIGGWVTA